MNNKKNICDIYLAMAICHNAVIEKRVKFNNKEVIKYSASSPDELALINYARDSGFIYLNKNENDVIQI